jgi:tetratricopeptide (TPR) repeat protein
MMGSRHIGWGLVLFLSAFAFYLHGAYPTVSVGDAGEFITVGHTLGIPHAPGYPSYVLLAKTADLLLPWANSGYRINLLSVFCGALSVAFLFWIAVRLGLSEVIAFCVAVAFLLSRAQTVNSQASEVFALHTLLCAVVLCAAVYDQWRLAAFVAGWGLGNHQTLVLLLPALALAYLSRPADERPPISQMIFGFMGGLSVYGFLYIRAQDAPVFNAGDPSTLERFWRVLIRADYGSLTLALGDTPPRDLPSTFRQLGRFVLGMVEQVTWIGIAAGVLGCVAAFRARAASLLAVAGGFLLIGPFFFVLGNLPFNGQSLGLLERFYIVPAFLWTLLIAAGFQWIADKRRILSWIALALPLLLIVEQSHAITYRNDFRAYAYGRNNLKTLPANALFIMDGGDDTFYTLGYLTLVEKRRPDLRLHDRGGVVYPGLYGTDFRSLDRNAKEARRQQVERAIVSSGQPMLYSTMNDTVLAGYALKQNGLLYSTDGRARPDLWDTYDLRGVAPWSAFSTSSLPDYRTRALVPFYAYQYSVQSARDARWKEATAYASSAQAQGSDVLWLIPNLLHNAYQWGQMFFNSGQLDMAASLFRDITRWDPRTPEAWSNLGAVEERRQKLDEAIRCYQKAIELAPQSEAAHYNLAVAYWKRADWPRVIEQFSRVIAINPGNVAAQNYLAQARTKIRER